MPRPICQLGDPILTQPATPITDVGDPEVQRLIADLLETMQEAEGVGIAAPQVGVGLQLLIVASRPNPRYPTAPQMDPLPMINPRLLAASPEQEWGWEGCLSVPNQRGWLARAQSVVVDYTTLTGESARVEWQGFVARIFQHEYDHLQGYVFLQRDPGQLLSEADYQQQVLGVVKS
ncbi:MAG: peptide deformylase [Cyanobacteriota bacterium]|nr:peptide deformylase [Cyanobacteriota bacterium]